MCRVKKICHLRMETLKQSPVVVVLFITINLDCLSFPNMISGLKKKNKTKSNENKQKNITAKKLQKSQKRSQVSVLRVPCLQLWSEPLRSGLLPKG